MSVPGKAAGTVRQPRQKKGDVLPLPPGIGANGAVPTELAPGEVAADSVPAEKPKAKSPPPNKSVELTEEQYFALLSQWRRQFETSLDVLDAAIAAVNTAKMTHKSLGKKIAAECGKDAVERIKWLIELDTEDGIEKLNTEIRMVHWVAKWGNTPIGATMEMFDFDQGDLRPDTDKAFETGRLDGLAGKPFESKYGQGSPQYHRYSEGWQAGQEVLSMGFKPMEKPPEPLGPPESADTTPTEEFDVTEAEHAPEGDTASED